MRLFERVSSNSKIHDASAANSRELPLTTMPQPHKCCLHRIYQVIRIIGKKSLSSPNRPPTPTEPAADSERSQSASETHRGDSLKDACQNIASWPPPRSVARTYHINEPQYSENVSALANANENRSTYTTGIGMPSQHSHRRRRRVPPAPRFTHSGISQTASIIDQRIRCFNILSSNYSYTYVSHVHELSIIIIPTVYHL